MLGGYQILDLRGIDLTVGTSASNITDAKVLNQLRELRNHIQKDYNFAKPLNNQLKPVLIRYRDKKNSEKHEVAIYGNLEVLTNYYTFKINALGHGEKLSIEVVFEEKTDEYENKYWDIKTAKVLLSIDEVIGGDASIGGDMSVTGDASIGGDLEVTGKVSGKIALEDIEDAQGHKRFIEGLVKKQPIAGVTPKYTKWSLCGTHLMIVYALIIDSGTTIGTSTVLATVEDMPDWLKDKIIPLYNDFVSIVHSYNLGSGTDTDYYFRLQKNEYGNLVIYPSKATIVTVREENVRIEFDLLIDNEQPNP